MQPAGPYVQTGAAQDTTITRRSPDAEDLINIVRTNKSWLAAPALAGLVIAVVVAFLWPDTFVSTAVVRVVPPQVPEKLVPSNVNMAMTYRIGAMAQTIQSRATLSSIIETYGLYPRQRNSMPLDDIIDTMKDSIKIGEVRSIPGRDPRRASDMSAFQVSFRYENRYLAQKVAQDLASRFINENQRQRAYQSAMTTQFLKEQWLSAKAEVDKYEHKLIEFRTRNAGRLPEQWNATLQQSNAMDARINTLNGNITRLQQEKMVAEAEMRNLRDRIDSIMNVKPDEPRAYTDPRLTAFDERIRQSESELLRMLQNYKPTHPDVVRYQAQMETLKKEREAYITARETPSEEAAQPIQLTPEQARQVQDLNARIATMQIQLQAKDMQIDQNLKDIDAANLRIKQIQTQLMSAPASDQEYAALMREYDLAKAHYREMNGKMEQSSLATDLETRQQGETLEMLDQASLPDTPSEPKRPTIILMGFGAGLAVGGTLVFGKELKDKTLKTLKDVRAYTKLTILGSVPLLEHDLVVVRRRRLAWLAWSAACLLSTVIMGGAVYFYYANKI
ncbi:MAG: hypothetical protein KIT09_32480 [Bryobacteraceae bacterium]|nr:hypothetical protein [Bryobacteraceae bacterium]